MPQGSALGPLLYNISEYDIPIEECGHSGAIFADDNNIWALGTTLKEVEDILRSSLVQLEQWAGNLDLSFSVNKTRAIVFTRRIIDQPPKFYLCGQEIDYTNQVKILGCTFTSRLSWKPYMDNISSSCIKRLNIMKLMTAPTWGLKPDFLLEYYKKYIQSKIESSVTSLRRPSVAWT